MNDIIVTNLRIEKNYLFQIKAMAAEGGMSLNEFITSILKSVSTKKQLAKEITVPPSQAPIWDLPNIAKKMQKKPMKLSDEDEIIYG